MSAPECTVCGRNDVVTEEGEVPRCSRHVLTQRSYEVEVLVSITIDGDDEAAYAQVDTILQRAWDTDRGRHHVGPWHFEMLEGCVRDITDVEAGGVVTDETPVAELPGGTLCATCQVPGHDACSMMVGCRCCEQTLAQATGN